MPMKDFVTVGTEYLGIKPWEKLTPGGMLVLCVECEEENAYVILTGKDAGGALLLFPDTRALADYAVLMKARAEQTDEMDLISLQLDQDYLEFREHAPDRNELDKWMKVFGVKEKKSDVSLYLKRQERGHLPRMINSEERDDLTLVLNVVMDLAANEPLGDWKALQEQMKDDRIPCARLNDQDEFEWRMMEQAHDVPVEYPSPSLEDELAARRLRRLPVSGAEVTCAVRMLPVPMDDNAERVAMVMLLLDDRMGVVAAPVIEDYEEQYVEMASEYIGYVEECGRPKRITAVGPRAYCLLNELAGQMSTPIRRVESAPEIDDAMRSMLNFMKSSILPKKKTAGKAAKASGQGICLYCEKEYAASGMTKHIKACGAEHRQPGDAEYFMIRVTAADDPNFWLYVDIKKDASLRQLDQFLRDTWVECCGHMSAFIIGGEEYLSDASEGGYGMNTKLMKVLKNGAKFSYEYDFGTTTELRLQVVDEYAAKDRRKKAVLAARNIMPKYQCVKCGKRAELVLRMGMEPIEDCVFCEECAGKEEYADGMLPLLNSPRTGLCGYGELFGMDDE